MKQYHYSADEQGMETIFKIDPRGNGVSDILFIQKDESGSYYWGCSAEYIDEQTLNSREAFLQFMFDHNDDGFSIGSYDSVDDINKDEEYADFIPLFGLFEDF